MGTSARGKRRAPVGVRTQGVCSGHEDCGTGKCSHRPKPWFVGQSRPGHKYNKRRRTARIARRRSSKPNPAKAARGTSRTSRRAGTKTKR